MGLPEILQKVTRQTRLSNREEKVRVWSTLDQLLQDHDLPGKVVSVLVRQPRGRINCYGARIPGARLFEKLNMSIGAGGSRVAGSVSYPELHRIVSYQKGYFVPSEEFGLLPGNYVAVVNIPINPDYAPAIPYAAKNNHRG